MNGDLQRDTYLAKSTNPRNYFSGASRRLCPPQIESHELTKLEIVDDLFWVLYCQHQDILCCKRTETSTVSHGRGMAASCCGLVVRVL